MQRIVIFGNSGSGKSTFARQKSAELACPMMDLDTVAWDPEFETPTRRPLAASAPDIQDFINASPSWVVEGCYADLLALALPYATDVVFLNPGTETCIENARQRPWEPHKYSSPEAQDANLEMLIAWISDYEHRVDEFSYGAHRRLFDGFHGRKLELQSNARAGAFSHSLQSE